MHIRVLTELDGHLRVMGNQVWNQARYAIRQMLDGTEYQPPSFGFRPPGRDRDAERCDGCYRLFSRVDDEPLCSCAGNPACLG